MTAPNFRNDGTGSYSKLSVEPLISSKLQLKFLFIQQILELHKNYTPDNTKENLVCNLAFVNPVCSYDLFRCWADHLLTNLFLRTAVGNFLAYQSKTQIKAYQCEERGL